LGLVPLFIITQSQASQLAIIIMAAVGFGLLPFLSSFTRKAVGVVLITFALFMPFLSAIAFDLVEKLPLYESFIPTTGLMRLENWDFITREILKSPWVGFGIDSARHMTFTSDRVFYPLNDLLHPHNGFLQMWLDFGVLGAIVMAIGIGIYISRRTNIIHFTAFVGTMVILLLSWSIWSSWLIGGLFAVHALIILASKSRHDQLTS
jgi:O-antigen ligase